MSREEALGILIAVGIMIACIPFRMFADWLFEKWVCKGCICKDCEHGCDQNKNGGSVE